MAQQEPGEDLPGARVLPLDLIDASPFQPRLAMDPDRLAEMTASIATYGLVQPVLVRPGADGHFTLIAGHRRAAAARAAGLLAIPAIILGSVADETALLLTATENLQREDLTLAEEAAMYSRLIDLGVARSNRQLAGLLGVPATRIDRALRFVPYPTVLAAIAGGTLGLVTGLKLLDRKDLLAAVEAGQLDPALAGRLALTPDPEPAAGWAVPEPPAPSRVWDDPPVPGVGRTWDDPPQQLHPLPLLLPPLEAVPLYTETDWAPPPERRWRALTTAADWAATFDPGPLDPPTRQALLAEVEIARARLDRLAAALRTPAHPVADGVGAHV